MPMEVDKDKYVTGASGTMLRFSLTMKLTAKHWSRKDGCLAARNADGTLDVMPPAQFFWVGGRRVKYRNENWSAELKAALVKHIEAAYGENITVSPVVAAENVANATPTKRPRKHRAGSNAGDIALEDEL